MRNDNDLDLLLNSALSTYADKDSDSGLEERILARVACAESSAELKVASRRHWLPGIMALPVAACLLLFFATPRAPRQKTETLNHSQSQTQQVISTLGQLPVPVLPKSIRRTAKSASRPEHKETPSANISPPRPKLEVFPTPQQLTPQEQALLRYTAQIPEPQRAALIETPKPVDAPLNIAAIRIPPLETTEDAKN
jgi:cytoskeletal protein RodZ